MDRRQAERRHRVQPNDPERRAHDRRSRPSPEDSLRYSDQGLLVVRQLQEAHSRLASLVERLPAARDVGGSSRIGETAAPDRHQQVIKWIEEGQVLLRILPELLQETEHWKLRAEAAEYTSGRFAQEISRLQSENEFFRKERGEIGEAVGNLMTEILLPLREKLKTMPSIPKRSPFQREPGR